MLLNFSNILGFYGYINVIEEQFYIFKIMFQSKFFQQL